MIEEVVESGADQPTAPDPDAYDSSDPVQVNKQRRKAGRKRVERLEFVKAMMAVREGRAWMYGHLEACHVFHTSFVAGDPHATSFRCGEHNVGLRLLADVMAAAPEQYVEMIKEAKNG